MMIIYALMITIRNIKNIIKLRTIRSIKWWCFTKTSSDFATNNNI